MKAFIAVALLVASVAAGPLSYERSLLNGHGKIGGLRGLPLSTVRDAELERVTLPLLERLERLGGERSYGSVYNYNNVLTFEELYNTEIFREYLNIPLFRQYLEVPAFQRYIVSPLFQRFFVYREFQQYFRTPALFYKYVYPQIVAISENVPTTRTTVNDFVDTIRPVVGDRVVRDNVDTIRSIFGDRFVDSIRSVLGRDNVDSIRSVYGDRTVRDNVFGDRTVRDNVFGDRTVRDNVYGDIVRDNVDFDVLRRQYQGINYPRFADVERRGVYGQQQLSDNVEIKYLLEKIYRDIVLNKNTVVPTTEVVTDVKVLPRERVAVEERIVDPITGRVRVVDEQVIPRVQEITRETPIVDRLVRDALYNTVQHQDRFLGQQQVRQNFVNRPVNTLENLINREIQY